MLNSQKISGLFWGLAACALVGGQDVASAQEAQLGTDAGASSEITGCPAFNTKRSFNHDVGFWGRVVTEAPVTLVADTDHRDPHIHSFLADGGVIKSWAENGVTDVYLEIQPEMKDFIAPYLSPVYVHDGLKEALKNHITEKGAFAAGNFAEIRAGYLADFFGHAIKNGIWFHFISDKPQIAVDNPDMTDLYRKMTLTLAHDCEPASQKKFMDFLSTLDDATGNRFYGFLQEVKKDRSDDSKRVKMMKELGHGGRKVAVFGNGHFQKETPTSFSNILKKEGMEFRYVEVYPNRDHMYWGWEGDYTYFYDSGAAEDEGRPVYSRPSPQ